MQTAEPETTDQPQAIATVASPSGGWLGVIDKLIDRGCPVADLQKIFEMQQAYLKEQARLAFKRDYAAFRAECPRLEKDKLVSFTSAKGTTSYRHILIATAVDTLTPILSAHGLSHRWETRQKDGGIIEVTCYLEHEAGHSESATLWGQADMTGNKNSIQAVSSTVTYLQRYTFLTVTGSAAADGDDDGNGAGKFDVLDAEQLKEIERLCKEIEDAQAKSTAAGTVIESPFYRDRFLEYAEAKEIRDILAAKFKQCKYLLASKLESLRERVGKKAGK